jgi:hypothetical protein
MKNNSSSPKLPGEDDSWESLATNLFGIDFSKPAIPAEDEISFELSPKLDPPSVKKTETEEVPPDEDVRLTEAAEEADFDEEEAGFLDEEAGFPDEDEDDFDEPEPEFSVKLASGAAQEDPFAAFDEEDEEEDLVAEEVAEEEDDEAEEEEDTYWEALNDFEWDADEDQPPSRPGGSPRRGSSRSGPPRSREREQRPERKSERTPDKKREEKKASVEERAIVDEEIDSAADYINE